MWYRCVWTGRSPLRASRPDFQPQRRERVSPFARRRFAVRGKHGHEASGSRPPIDVPGLAPYGLGEANDRAGAAPGRDACARCARSPKAHGRIERKPRLCLRRRRARPLSGLTARKAAARRRRSGAIAGALAIVRWTVARAIGFITMALPRLSGPMRLVLWTTAVAAAIGAAYSEMQALQRGGQPLDMPWRAAR